MRKAIGALIVFFGAIVFFTFMMNHGHVDFRGIDWITKNAKEIWQSDETQGVVAELKDIAFDTAGELTKEAKELIADYKDAKNPAAVELISVVDGDTIMVKYRGEEVKVRLIGMDTPESVNADESKNTIYGTYASEYTKEILDGVKTVYLEFDQETSDVYGRVLAYVWLKSGQSHTTESIGKYMLNGILVKDGYALDKVYAPNDRYSVNFTKLRIEAKESENGLWKYEEVKKLWQ